MDIVRLLALVLRCNNFEFNDKHYLQIRGVAMGTKAAPTIANWHMGEFEDNHIYTYPLQPLFYGHFIDDEFFIWQHGLMELMKFFNTPPQQCKQLHQIHLGYLSQQWNIISKPHCHIRPWGQHQYLSLHKRNWHPLIHTLHLLTSRTCQRQWTL